MIVKKLSDGFWLVVLLSLGDHSLSALNPLGSEGPSDASPHSHTLSQFTSVADLGTFQI